MPDFFHLDPLIISWEIQENGQKKTPRLMMSKKLRIGICLFVRIPYKS